MNPLSPPKISAIHSRKIKKPYPSSARINLRQITASPTAILHLVYPTPRGMLPSVRGLIDYLPIQVSSWPQERSIKSSTAQHFFFVHAGLGLAGHASSRTGTCKSFAVLRACIQAALSIYARARRLPKIDLCWRSLRTHGKSPKSISHEVTSLPFAPARSAQRGVGAKLFTAGWLFYLRKNWRSTLREHVWVQGRPYSLDCAWAWRLASRNVRKMQKDCCRSDDG